MKDNQWAQMFNLEPRSEQLELEGLGFEGEELARRAEEWVEQNKDAYMVMVDEAYRLAKTGRISAKYLVERMRAEKRVGIDNRLTACVARMIIRQNPQLSSYFETEKSKSDGFIV